ncbi:hypothetical protein SHJG_2685 [Streptomyces hygroscopicus subsp. jinggangensis 5008]|nr:hypothetical protein SHJG_2685 [Streptomyces hygroscopicus subsp. jinggangensis 5008]AGF62115.1 hypothetical protein SHJGH_2449 [Streptomyces hygroscopicus subsp. jinggangensis TL01]
MSRFHHVRPRPPADRKHPGPRTGRARRPAGGAARRRASVRPCRR